ncbi:zinc finger protein 41 homolog isoform X1 [Enhydra lutris kenyoni]|uniref:Zinc finger protein 41 homolog isoform X1 n=1 Tax=Enhydra lutris kenyoni TaxID=391180 RepID=A0A2Y9JBW7_ENHLU|nr:zinc finger protein 41 homolog isoform X1 [Enhydra lutris kenyoni]
MMMPELAPLPGPSAALPADSACPRRGRRSRGTHRVWSSMGKVAAEDITGTFSKLRVHTVHGGQSCTSFRFLLGPRSSHLSLLGRTLSKVFPGVCGHAVCDLLSDVQQRIQDLCSLGARRGRWRALVVPAPGAGRQTSSVKGRIVTIPGPAALRRLSPLNSTAACDRSPHCTSERAWPSSAEAVCAETGSHQAGCCRGRTHESRPSRAHVLPDPLLGGSQRQQTEGDPERPPRGPERVDRMGARTQNDRWRWWRQAPCSGPCRVGVPAAQSAGRPGLSISSQSPVKAANTPRALHRFPNLPEGHRIHTHSPAAPRRAMRTPPAF